jgi:tryptophan synthase alpha chain
MSGTAAVGTVFEKARAEGRSALVGYLPAGFPTYDTCIDAIKVMVAAGVDLVEVGLPYSDPVLDGPTIQAAADISLSGGTRTKDVLRTVEAVTRAGAVAVVMTYWNPVLRYGVHRFARDLAAAGGAGLITPDLTPDVAGEWITASDQTDLARIFLVAPSSPDPRVALTAAACRGFVYAASVMGVTGARASTSAVAPALVARVRAVSSLPVGVGLGVSSGAQAALIAEYADGVIVGSALCRSLLEATSPQDGLAGLRRLVEDLAAGVRR